MRRLGWHLATVLALSLAVMVTGCEFSFSTANVRSAVMARDAEGNQPTSTFTPTETFHCLVDLANAVEDTVLKASWVAVETQGAPPNTLIDEAEVSTSSGTVDFDLSNTAPWPAGTYRVDIYLNGELDRSLDFQVQGAAGPTAPTGAAKPPRS
jgi:hypothetical protein